MVHSVTQVEVQLRPTWKETVTENSTSTESADTKTVTSEINSVDEKGRFHQTVRSVKIRYLM